MNCQELREMIADYLAGKLSPDDLRRFEAHRMECEKCRVELEESESAWTSLGQLPDEVPGPELRGRFYAMLESEKRRIARAERRAWLKRLDSWLGSWWPRRPVVQMGMAAVLLVVGFAVGSGLEPAPEGDEEVAQLRTEVRQMQEMVSMSLLGQSSTSERLRGVNWSARVDNPSDALLTSLENTLESDPSVNVRLAAVDALGFFRNEPGVVEALTNALAHETSPTVQIALIDMLTVIQEKKALEALRRFVDSQRAIPSVKEHAEKRIGDFT
jgi:hypothetical protein